MQRPAEIAQRHPDPLRPARLRRDGQGRAERGQGLDGPALPDQGQAEAEQRSGLIAGAGMPPGQVQGRV